MNKIDYRKKASETITGHLRYVVKDIKSRCKRKGKEFSITFDDLLECYVSQQGKCALSGIELTFTQGNGVTPTSLSVDRIDSNIGYIKGNVQLVCYIVNIMKHQSTIEELKQWCTKILDTSPKNK